MNQEQRKYLKSRLSPLRFSRYHQDSDDTPQIVKLRREVEQKQKRIRSFEEKCLNKRKEKDRDLQKCKSVAFELIYGSDYKNALEHVRFVEKQYEDANRGVYN